MTTWKLDSAHTQVNFSAKHMMVTTVRGTFHDVEGTIELDEHDPTRSKGEFRVATASIDTNFGARDAHLRSPDFFDVERFPSITFTSTDIKAVGDDRYEVTGDLTIRDVTKPVTLDIEYAGQATSPWGTTSAGFSAQTKISRKEWGLNWNVALETGGWLVSDEIKINIELELVKQVEETAEVEEAVAI